MRIIGVECYADKYFFSRLLDNSSLIRKERNDKAVIDSVCIRSKDNFSIGIIDIDKNKKIPKEFLLLSDDFYTKVYKHNTKFQFLFTLAPRQFEHWVNGFLKEQNEIVENFGYSSFNEFMEESKSKAPETFERFKKVLEFVFRNFGKSENHVLKIKRQLEYLVNKKYQFNKEEFINV